MPIMCGTVWHGGSVACTACTAASQQEGHGFDSRMGRCWLWGAGPPQSAQCSSGLSPGPFCVEFACSPRVHKGFPPLRTPTEKHANRTILSVPDRDGRFTWSPGAEKLPRSLELKGGKKRGCSVSINCFFREKRQAFLVKNEGFGGRGY